MQVIPAIRIPRVPMRATSAIILNQVEGATPGNRPSSMRTSANAVSRSCAIGYGPRSVVTRPVTVEVLEEIRTGV